MTAEEIRALVKNYFERNVADAEEARLDGSGLLEENAEGGSNANGLTLHLEDC